MYRPSFFCGIGLKALFWQGVKSHSIYMRKILLGGIFLLTAPLLGWAQAYKAPSALAREILQQSLQRRALKNLPGLDKKILYWEQLQKNQFRDLDITLQSYFLPSGTGVSAAERAENTRLLQAMTRHWLNLDFYVSQHKQTLQPHISARAIQGTPSYTHLVPPDARLVMVGEVHKQPWIQQEVIYLLEQLKARHPQRNVYYASEFLFARPGEEISLLQEQDIEAFKVISSGYDDFLHRVFRTGVQVMGLETPHLRANKEQTENQPFFAAQQGWKAFSALGVRERNRYWEKQIRTLLQQDPSALIVLHAGHGHLNYTQLNSLSRLLNEFQPFVMEFSMHVSVNRLLDKTAPIASEVLNQGAHLKAQNPTEPVFYIRQVKNKQTARLMGCDVSIKAYAPRLSFELGQKGF